MLLENDTYGLFFRLGNLQISNDLKNKVLNLSKNYKENFRQYGKIRKRLYMHKVSFDDFSEVKDAFLNTEFFDSLQIMLIEPGCILSPHTDPDRCAAINIPISGNFDKSYLSFFENDGTGKPNDTHEKESGVIAKSPGIVFDKTPPLKGKVYYKTPVCINVTEVHNAVNMGNDNRILLTISTTKIGFNGLERLHKENSLLRL